MGLSYTVKTSFHWDATLEIWSFTMYQKDGYTFRTPGLRCQVLLQHKERLSNYNVSKHNYKARKKGGKTAEAKKAECMAKRQRINRHSIPRWCWWFLYRQPNQDVIGENCVHNAAGELNDKDKMKAWAEHCARVLNVEFEWPSNESSDVPTPNTHTTHTRTHERTHTHTHTYTYTCWPPPSVFATQIRKSLSKVKRNKAAGPSGIIAEMLKPTDEERVELVGKLAEAVFRGGMIPVDGRRASSWSPWPW